MSKIRILVVSEDADMRERLGRMIHREDVRIVFADGDQQGLDLMKQEAFQVLFTHLRASGASGLGVLRQALEVRPRLPVVIVSDDAELDCCIKAIECGDCGYLSGPLTREIIGEALTKALESRRSEDTPNQGACEAPEFMRGRGEPDDAIMPDSSAMREVVQDAIRRCQGSKAAAARLLGLHRRTLDRILQQNTTRAGSDESRGSPPTRPSGTDPSVYNDTPR